MLGIHFTEWQSINTTAIIKLTLATATSIRLRLDEFVNVAELSWNGLIPKKRLRNPTFQILSINFGKTV